MILMCFVFDSSVYTDYEVITAGFLILILFYSSECENCLENDRYIIGSLSKILCPFFLKILLPLFLLLPLMSQHLYEISFQWSANGLNKTCQRAKRDECDTTSHTNLLCFFSAY